MPGRVGPRPTHRVAPRRTCTPARVEDSQLPNHGRGHSGMDGVRVRHGDGAPTGSAVRTDDGTAAAHTGCDRRPSSTPGSGRSPAHAHTAERHSTCTPGVSSAQRTRMPHTAAMDRGRAQRCRGSPHGPCCSRVCVYGPGTTAQVAVRYLNTTNEDVFKVGWVVKGVLPQPPLSPAPAPDESHQHAHRPSRWNRTDLRREWRHNHDEKLQTHFWRPSRAFSGCMCFAEDFGWDRNPRFPFILRGHT